MAQLDALPKELLAHIATVADPTTVLQLSATCHAIRLACWDPVVLKQNLILSQQIHWESNSLEIEDIANHAQNDATMWAKYCIADERTRSLVDDADTLSRPESYVSYLPELFVARHPFYKHQIWKDALRFRIDQRPRQVFCIVMGTLSAGETALSLSKIFMLERPRGFTDDSNASGFLWALCKVALSVRKGLRIRDQAWPYNHAAIVPDIKTPTAEQIPLRLLSDEYNLPAPFSRRSIELLGKSTHSFSAWDSWYQLHNQHFLLSTDFLTQGKWCGYYVYLAEASLSPLNPPMTNIQFEHADTPVGEYGPAHGLHETRPCKIHAKDCVDGLDSFELEATVSYSSSGVKITARKNYVNRGHGWDWDCRLTPFGIVGYWGLRQSGAIYPLRKHGIVWLWREQWTQAA